MLNSSRRSIAIIILMVFFITSIKSTTYALPSVDQMPQMPSPGVLVHLSPAFTPAYLKGIVIHPENALKFDFIIFRGDKPLTAAQKQVEYTKLTKYFLASLAIPDDDQWVNLSPYEKDRIIKEDFGKTEMGRDLLAQDYMLKQITASLIYPENNLGKEFWDRVYAQAQEKFGTSNIPVNTFNKVWILPDSALIYEKGNTAYVLRNHLKVMLEEDYLSLQKHAGIQSAPVNQTHNIASKIVKEIVLPELEREVNEDESFAPLRQVYSGMLLAAWYKRALKESLLSKIYADKGKVKGVDQDPKTNEQIYQQYLSAYKKGVFNFIKEDMDPYTHEMVPRKYFSGGTRSYVDFALTVQRVKNLDSAQTREVQSEASRCDLAQVVTEEKTVAADAAQGANDRNTAQKEKSIEFRGKQYKAVLLERDHVEVLVFNPHNEYGSFDTFFSVMRRGIMETGVAKAEGYVAGEFMVMTVKDLDRYDALRERFDLIKAERIAGNSRVAADLLKAKVVVRDLMTKRHEQKNVPNESGYKRIAFNKAVGPLGSLKDGVLTLTGVKDRWNSDLWSGALSSFRDLNNVQLLAHYVDADQKVQLAVLQSMMAVMFDKDGHERPRAVQDRLVRQVREVLDAAMIENENPTILLRNGVEVSQKDVFYVTIMLRDILQPPREGSDPIERLAYHTRLQDLYQLRSEWNNEDVVANYVRTEDVRAFEKFLARDFTPWPFGHASISPNIRDIVRYVLHLGPDYRMWLVAPEGVVHGSIIEQFRDNNYFLIFDNDPFFQEPTYHDDDSELEAAQARVLGLTYELPTKHRATLEEYQVFEHLIECINILYPGHSAQEISNVIRIALRTVIAIPPDYRFPYNYQSGEAEQSLYLIAGVMQENRDVYTDLNLYDERLWGILLSQVSELGFYGWPKGGGTLIVLGRGKSTPPKSRKARTAKVTSTTHIITRTTDLLSSSKLKINDDTSIEEITIRTLEGKIFRIVKTPFGQLTLNGEPIEATGVNNKYFSFNYFNEMPGAYEINSQHETLHVQIKKKVKAGEAIDLAMNSAQNSLGGIDFNAAHLNLQIKRDGRGVPLPISQQDLAHIHIDGLIPLIINIKPASSLSIFSQLQNTVQSAH